MNGTDFPETLHRREQPVDRDNSHAERFQIASPLECSIDLNISRQKNLIECDRPAGMMRLVRGAYSSCPSSRRGRSSRSMHATIFGE
jgi:hypothetical protein